MDVQKKSGTTHKNTAIFPLGVGTTNRIRRNYGARFEIGPHHHAAPESSGVCPGHVSAENGRKGNECESYRNRYSFFPFGIVQGSLIR